jgi:hypothetical protein
LNITNSVPVWGYLSRYGPKFIKKINGRIDTSQYVYFLKQMVEENSSLIPMKFVHDKYPVHTSRYVQQWFKDNKEKIQKLPWHGDFGDVMPLEKVWQEILEMINKREIKIRSKDMLWQSINNCWNKLFEEQFFVGGCIYRIPLLLKNINENHGDWAFNRV